MPRRSQYEEDFDYEDDDYEDTRKKVRRLRKEPESYEKRKKLDRESSYERDHDYDDRR
mgnify:CR=1 FL=1